MTLRGPASTVAARRPHESHRAAQTPHPGRPELAVVTWTLVAVWSACWVAEVMLPGIVDLLALDTVHGAAEPWRLLTAMMAHSPNPLHLAADLVALYWFGRPLELALGRLRFAAVAVLGGLAGGIACLAVRPGHALPGADGHPLVVTASSIVLAVLGASLLVRRSGPRHWLLVGLVPVALVVLCNRLAGVWWPADVAALLTGLALAKVFTPGGVGGLSES